MTCAHLITPAFIVFIQTLTPRLPLLEIAGFASDESLNQVICLPLAWLSGWLLDSAAALLKGRRVGLVFKICSYMVCTMCNKHD